MTVRYQAALRADDNTYLYAWAKDNPGYTVGIKTIGDESTIAPAVKKGNKSLLHLYFLHDYLFGVSSRFLTNILSK